MANDHVLRLFYILAFRSKGNLEAVFNAGNPPFGKTVCLITSKASLSIWELGTEEVGQILQALVAVQTYGLKDKITIYFLLQLSGPHMSCVISPRQQLPAVLRCADILEKTKFL